MTGLFQDRLPGRCLLLASGLAMVLFVSGCVTGGQILAGLFNTASLGGTTPGRRGNISVKFVNNTPYRAVFTFGTYDPLNTAPVNPLGPPADRYSVDFPINGKFGQFVVDTTNGGTRLNAFSESDVITFQADPFNALDPGGCGRGISVGGAQLVSLIEKDTTLVSFDGLAAQPAALKPLCDTATNTAKAGVAFFLETSAGPSDNACDSADEVKAFAAGAVTQQGRVNQTFEGPRYPADSTVTFTFVQDDTQPGGIRIDVSVEPPATN
jgi:hypothetical protein